MPSLRVSVVVILDSTFSVHTFLAASSRLSILASSGISSSTLEQACSTEMKDTPTRETMFFASPKEKTAPRRFTESLLNVSS